MNKEKSFLKSTGFKIGIASFLISLIVWSFAGAMAEYIPFMLMGSAAVYTMVTIAILIKATEEQHLLQEIFKGQIVSVILYIPAMIAGALLCRHVVSVYLLPGRSAGQSMLELVAPISKAYLLLHITTQLVAIFLTFIIMLSKEKYFERRTTKA